MTHETRNLPFVWNGKEISTWSDVRDVMLDINTRKDDDQAKEFTGFLRETSKGKVADAMIFRISGMSESAEEMSEMLTRFSGINCRDVFHIIEYPADEFGNTGMPKCVRKVKIQSGEYKGWPEIKVLEPNEVLTWQELSTTAHGWLVTEGPARMLTNTEWKELVQFEYKP
jgi:hypothetical protein